ncbi:hypothetical protein GCM10011608_01710 [Micromonospora sonchi]|uniref:Uncharacterized protein n=1 Tax=Micromonospora sonchi TaxID=1763543 RepID=A0A917TER5_9ACTN|nr:DUF6365 family protein [Micromonospora sonchi]GGM20764.1 hypothetical protein GCM10011608_01710 [Micromonospora sonchi]
MKILFLAPSRLSHGDAGIAADLARRLPRNRFQVGFVAAAEAMPQLHEVGLPTLPLGGVTPDENLAVLDRVVRGFRPDCLVAADAFALHQARAWSGLTLSLLRERYGLPVGSVDRLGWQAAGYTVDSYGGGQVRIPPLLDGCDLLIRTSPPHPPESSPPGVAVAALHPGGLHDNGLRPAVADAAPRGDGPPVVFLVNSPWEHRTSRGSLPAAQLVDALPRIVHGHLAALDRPLRVIHVGPRRWRFPVAEQIDYQHFGRLPYPMFHARLAAADLFLTTNVLSATLGRAVLAGVPALVLENDRVREASEFPDWLATLAPLLRTAYPFRVAPLGWYDLVGPLLSGNPYRECFATAGIFERTEVLRHLTGLLDDDAVRSRLRQRQHDYRDRLAEMAPPVAAFQEAVSR